MGYIRIQHRPGLTLGALMLSLCGFLHAAPEIAVIPFDKAKDLMTAVGKLKLTTAQLENSLHYCAQKFPHLKESAHHAQLSWQKENQTIVSQTALVNSTVIESVRQYASPFIAEKMALEMDHVVSQSVQHLTTEFTMKSRKEQHYLCNRLILSTAAGERDLQTQNPDETHRLMTFKQ